MIEWLALVIGSLALGLNVLFVRKIGKVLQATDAARFAFSQIKNDAKEAKEILAKVRYWVDYQQRESQKEVKEGKQMRGELMRRYWKEKTEGETFKQFIERIKAAKVEQVNAAVVEEPKVEPLSQ